MMKIRVVVVRVLAEFRFDEGGGIGYDAERITLLERYDTGATGGNFVG